MKTRSMKTLCLAMLVLILLHGGPKEGPKEGPKGGPEVRGCEENPACR